VVRDKQAAARKAGEGIATMSYAGLGQPPNPCPGGFVVLSDEGQWCSDACPAPWETFTDHESGISWCFTEGRMASEASAQQSAEAAEAASVPLSRAALAIGAAAVLVFAAGAYWYRRA
jgi:hypothetical protein